MAGSRRFFMAIERYGMAQPAWLETFLELPDGIPSHDTFGRVMTLPMSRLEFLGMRILSHPIVVGQASCLLLDSRDGYPTLLNPHSLEIELPAMMI